MNRLSELAKGNQAPRLGGKPRRHRPRDTYTFHEAAIVLGFGRDRLNASKLIRAHIPFLELPQADVVPSNQWDSARTTRIYIRKADLDAYVAKHELEIAERSMRRGTLR